jgi:N-acetylmuramoyl-L-alanine amidase
VIVFRKRLGSALVALLVAVLPLSLSSQSSVEVYDLRSYTHPTYTRIVVDIGKLREYDCSELKEPDRIYVDVYQATLNPLLHGKTYSPQCDYLKEIRIAQKTPTTVRVVAELDKARIDRYQVFTLFDPFRIVIDIYPKEAAAPVPPEKTPQPAEPTPSGYSLIRQLGLGVKTVVIDPGHGGQDPGCISKKGQKEKDVVLDIALELRNLLIAGKKLNVILTRESDIFIPLENRTIIANQQNADLFVSIHANAHRDRKRKGVQTFYLNFSPDPRVNEIAARENATSTKNIGAMQETIKKIAQNSKVLESRDLAEKIQKNLVKWLSVRYAPVTDLGLRGGPFWVLIGSEMPAVLVEISHLSNAQDAERLRNPAYRKQVARGIYEGLLEYMRSLGKG